MSPRPLIARLIERALPLSRCVADALFEAEGILTGRGGEQTLGDEQFLEQAYGTWCDDLVPDDGRPAAALQRARHQMAARLSRTIIRAWSGGGERSRRPDVLGLTCELLANPELPHTYKLSRYSVVLAVRSLYRIPYENESLKALRRHYLELQDKFVRSDGQRPRNADRYTRFLLDLLCLEGCLTRDIAEEAPSRYYERYKEHSFGVLPERVNALNKSLRFWRTGNLPEFGSLLNMAFAQPTGIPGLDDVLGGLLASIPGEGALAGGLVTLVSGAPGSGKTSLCLALSSRMAELGSTVRYIGTEEGASDLEAKLTSLSNPLSASLLLEQKQGGTEERGDFAFIDGRNYPTIKAIHAGLRNELAPLVTSGAEWEHQGANTEYAAENNGAPVYLVFPRVVVIDSLSALAAIRVPHGGHVSTTLAGWRRKAEVRKALSDVLFDLRQLGVCVILVGGTDDGRDEDLAYLVDNVLHLFFDKGPSYRHPLRILNVEKTRLQTSNRGQHVLHISDNGCSVSPSLESVLKALKPRGALRSSDDSRAVLWVAPGNPQLDAFSDGDLDGIGRKGEASILTLRGNSEVLIYGRGTSSKTRLGLALAFEPRVSRVPEGEFAQYCQNLALEDRSVSEREQAYLARSRVLVISFQHRETYYLELAGRAISSRFGVRTPDLRTRLHVLRFHPGLLDPETVVATIRRELRGADLVGRPYTAVLIDGIQNQLIQFPLLSQEPLLWPTVYQLLRTRRIETVTTFSLFRFAEARPWRTSRAVVYARGADQNDTSYPAVGRGSGQDDQSFSAAESTLYQLLVGSCDYSFAMEQYPEPPGTAGISVPVHLATTATGIRSAVPELLFDPTTFRFRTPTPVPLRM